MSGRSVAIRASPTRRREVGEREAVALRGEHLREEPVGAAVHVVHGHHELPGRDELEHRGDRRHAGREGEAVLGELERGEALLERRARRVDRARVVVSSAHRADAVLGVGGRLVDRHADRAGQRIGLLPVVDRAGLELHQGISVRSRPSVQARRSSASRSARGRGRPCQCTAIARRIPAARSAFMSTRPTIDGPSISGQHVVAVDALAGPLVDLEPVLEAEQLLGLGAVPQHVVERRDEERAGRRGRAVREQLGVGRVRRARRRRSRAAARARGRPRRRAPRSSAAAARAHRAIGSSRARAARASARARAPSARSGGAAGRAASGSAPPALRAAARARAGRTSARSRAGRRRRAVPTSTAPRARASARTSSSSPCPRPRSRGTRPDPARRRSARIRSTSAPCSASTGPNHWWWRRSRMRATKYG